MIKLYNGNGGEVEITPTDDSYRLKELMGADEVVLKFALPDYLAISAGAYINYKGDRYEVESEDSVRMIHTEEYEYTVTFSSPRAHLRRYIVREKGGEGRITFFLTAKPREHLDLIVHNLNEREAGWAVGACIDGAEKTIEYSTTNALDALQKLAEAYGTEWECEGRTLSLRKSEYHKDSPLTVSYGKGKGLLSGLERNPAEEQPVGTLYVTGTDRNIDPAKYKSKTLHLPEGGTKTVGGRTYTVTSGGRAITVSGSAPGAVEGAFTDTDVYPSREGVVGAVTIRDKEKAFVDFTDPTIPADLDLEQCLIPGREMKLTFQSGMLSGRTFGAKYVHKDRRFEIVPEEIDGVLMPSAPYLPKEGDRYGVFEIALPESYIRSAEGRLLDSAVQYLEGLETSRYSYRAAVDPLWLKKQWTKVGHKVRIGAYVKLAGDPITDGGATLRITGIKEYLTDPYAPEVTLSDRATGRGGLTSIIRKAVQDDLTSTREASTRAAVELSTRSYRKAEELTKALEQALSADFDAKIRPIAVHTMQVLVGDKSLQFAYVESPSSTKEVPLPLTFDTATKSLHIDRAYLQHKTLGVEVTTAHTAKDFRTWTIAPIDYSPKGTAPLYLYARVPREGDGGTFVIDTRAHDFKEEAGWYHLWSGMLTPTDDGTRWEYMPMHGFTEITPGMISSPRFTSPDGRLVIDMVKGYFRFKTDKSTFSVNADNPDGVYIRGGMISVGGQNVTMEEAFEEQERKIENAKKVRQPIIKNGTWWVWDDTTNQLIDSGKPAQGESGHSLTSSLAFVEGEIRNGVVTKDPVVEYVVYYDGVALDDKLVYDKAGIGNPPDVSFEMARILIVGKNRFGLYVDDNNRSKPNGISQTYAITYKGLTTIATATLPNVRDGERGLQGLQGKDGRDGINGKDGTSSYTHIAYATDDKGGNFSQSPEGCDYIGMYVDSNQTDSTNPNDYRWTKFVGEDGRNGSDGTPGKPGKDGRTPYLHIAYANSSDGKQGFSVTESSGRDYIGQYTDYTQSDSSDPSRYTWFRIKGEQGATGKDGAPGRDGHSFTATLRVEGEVADGQLDLYKLRPSFFYDGREVTEEIGANFYSRFNLNERGKTWIEWELYSRVQDGAYDLSDTYTGPGVSFEVKATYKGLTAVAAAFVPHVISPEKLKELEEARFLAEEAQGVSRQLWEYVDGAFKDGIVDGAEAKAIKTYINEVDAQWQSALGAYEKVYQNPLLTGAPKTALLDCKTTLAGKCDDLTQYIATAIGDGRATADEVDGVNFRYNAYKIALRDFQKALKTAEQAIRDAGKTTGGRNLLRSERIIKSIVFPFHLYYDEISPREDAHTYTLSFDYWLAVDDPATDRRVCVSDGLIFDRDVIADAKWHHKVYTFDLPTEREKYPIKSNWLADYSSSNGRTQDQVKVRNVKLERGVVATDWTPAPEDVQAEIDAERSAREAAVREVASGLANANTSIATLKTAKEEIEKGKLSAGDLPAHLKWIYDAFNEGETIKEGGLVLTQIIGLSNIDGKITAYLSGRNAKGAHMLAAGVSGLAAQDATSYINYDGTAKFGPFTVNKEGILYLDQNATKLEKPVPNRLYMGAGGIFSYDSGGGKVFGASASGGFKSELVNIGGGGSSYIKSPFGLTLQGYTDVIGDLTERGKRVHLDTPPSIVDLTESASVSLTADDRVVTLWNETHTSSHVTVTLPSATEVPEGWQCLVTTFGPVTSGSITMTTKSLTEKWFWGSEGIGYTHDYSEKTNMIWIIRIPKCTANGNTFYWAVKEIRAY